MSKLENSDTNVWKKQASGNGNNIYYSVFEQNPIAVAVVRITYEDQEKLHLEYANPAMKILMELDHVNEKSQKEQEREKEAREFLCDTNKSKKVEHRTFYAERQSRYIEVTAYCSEEPDCIICMASDITKKVLGEKKRVEEKISDRRDEKERIDFLQKQMEERLMESRQNLSVAIRHAGIHYWTYDLMTNRVYMDKHTSQDFQLAATFENYPEDWFNKGMVYPEDIPNYMEEINKIRNGAPHANFMARIYNLSLKHYEWRNFKFTTFYDAEGMPSYAIATSEEVEDYKKLENQLRQVMSQNGILSWELNLREHTMESIGASNWKQSEMAMNRQESEKSIPSAFLQYYTVYEEDLEKCREMFEQLYQGKENVTEQIRCRKNSDKNSNRNFNWYQFNFTIVEKEEEVPIRAIGTSRDITLEKRMEQLYQEEQKMHLTEDASLLASSRINLTQGIVESMKYGGKSVPYGEISFLTGLKERISHFFDVVQIDEEDEKKFSVENLIHSYREGVENLEKIFMAKTKDKNQYIYVKMSCKLMERPDTGDIIAFFYYRNYTKHYTDQLTMETLLKTDYELAGIIFANTQNLYIISSDVLYSVPGYVNLDYDSEIQRLAKFLDKERAEEILEKVSFAYVRKMLESKPVYTIDIDWKGDEIRHKQLRYTYADEEKSVILFTRIDVEDIVQKEKEKQLQLEEALNAAEKANNAKTEFLSTVSHEIRTPLNVIIGMTQMAKEEASDYNAVMESIEEIEVSSSHLLNLVNNILDVAKIESGEFSMHTQRYSYRELKKNVINLIRPLCRQKNITFIQEEFGEQRDIMIDKVRLNQVLFNLLSNAVKYTPEHGEVRLIYHDKVKDGMLEAEFVIKDNGIGMSKEFQEQMFKPFTQERNAVTESTQGTGLGLPIVKGIIDKMGGTLTVESELGKGSSFYVRITAPLAEDEMMLDDKIEVSRVNFSGKVILVVEDHNLNRMIISRLLTKRGATVLLANDGKEGVETFQKSETGSIDAILMDVRMPVMDGLEATSKIRSLAREDAKTVPIFAMTANAYDEDRDKSSAAGMNEHISKPIDTTVLYSTLNAYLQ